MKQHNDLLQGSPKWHAFRADHFGASEASSMLGLSPYMTRSELLKAKATGLSKDVDAETQRIFDRGHEVEALARPIIESRIEDELYPVTESKGKLSASCDGLTMDETIAWENKQYSAKLFESISNGILPEHHWPQCQQVLYVTGAEKLLFTCSNGDDDGTVSMWVYPDSAKQDAIIAGWAQFERDLADYAPVNVIEPPKAEAIKDFPAVTVQVKGELTLCNIGDVTPLFDKFLSEAKTELVTDNDFAQAEAEAKLGRETAKRCKLIAKAVVDQMLSISEVTRTLEEYAAKFDAMALKQEKAVKEQKEARKASAKLERDKLYAEHFAALNAGIKPITLILSQADKPDFVGSMKNQRTLESLYNKLDTELARAKIAADAVTKEIREKLDWCKESSSGFGFLFNDLQQIIYKPENDFRLIVTSRIEAHKNAEEEKRELERKRIRAEEEAKANAKAAADQQAKLDAEREQIRKEEQVRAQIQAEEKLRAEQAEKDRSNQELKQSEAVRLVDIAELARALEIDSAMEQSRACKIDADDHEKEKAYHQEKPIKGSNSSIEMVTIPKSEYENLLSRSEWLACLEDAGVDNWTGIDHAKEMLEELQSA